MTFNYEHQMTAPAERWLRAQGLLVKKEFQVPWGICDLVGCSFDEEKVLKRLEYGQTKHIGSQLRAMMLSKIPDRNEGKSITFDELHESFSNFLNERKVGTEIKKLVKDKFVHITPQGMFQKLNGWMPIQNKIVALELKLHRIEEVLHQAINNLEFADESYVGLPMRTAERLSTNVRGREFTAKGIGILGVTANECKVMLKPNPINSYKNEFVQCYSVEKFWTMYLKDN